MARDKLITIRIEGEKREAFNNLAKSQNTDTASLLYDFISGCLSGTIDIKLVTGKKQWIDKIDNQLDSKRIDKLETATQEIDNRLGTIAKKLNDWIEAIDDRLTDSDQGLGEKITSLENRLNALAIQLDSQLDRQRENRDMGTVAIVETAINTVEAVTEIDESVDESGNSPLPPSPLPTGEPVRPAIETVVTVEAVYSVETADKVETDIETVEAVTDTVETAIDTVESVESDSTVELVTGSIASDKGMTSAAAYRFLVSKNLQISPRTLDNWINSKIPESAQGRKAKRYIILKDKKYYSIE